MITSGNSSRCVCGSSPSGEGEEAGVGEEEEVDTPSSLEAALSYLGLSEHVGVFEREQIDFDSLVSSKTGSHNTVLPPSLPPSLPLSAVDDQ